MKLPFGCSTCIAARYDCSVLFIVHTIETDDTKLLDDCPCSECIVKVNCVKACVNHSDYTANNFKKYPNLQRAYMRSKCIDYTKPGMEI